MTKKEKSPRHLTMGKLKPPYLPKFVALAIGYLAGDLVVQYTKPPQGLPVILGFLVVLTITTAVVVSEYPRGSYGRMDYQYWVGQLGVWIMGLLVGGFLPLLKSFVYSSDLLVRLLLGTWVLALLYLFLLIQEWFDIPRPAKA